MKATKTTPESPSQTKRPRAGATKAPKAAPEDGRAPRQPHRLQGAATKAERAAADRQAALDLLRERGVDPDSAAAEWLRMDSVTKKWQAGQKKSTKFAIGYLNTILCKESLPKGSLARASLERCKAENERALANITLAIPDRKAAGGQPRMLLFWACSAAARFGWPPEVAAALLWLEGVEEGDWHTVKHRVSQYWSKNGDWISELAQWAART
jgi:hypothetical protein